MRIGCQLRETRARLIAKIRHCLHLVGLVRQRASSFRQMTGKVGQISCREDLDRMTLEICFCVLQSFQYGLVCLPVSVENVPKKSSQLVDLNRRWVDVHLGGDGVSVLHIGFMFRCLASSIIIVPPSWRSILMEFWEVEVSTPVIGKLIGLGPRINPTIWASTNVTNNPIEEILRHAVSMDPELVHFSYHQIAILWKIRILSGSTDFNEVVSVDLAMSFCGQMLQRMRIRQRLRRVVIPFWRRKNRWFIVNIWRCWRGSRECCNPGGVRMFNICRVLTTWRLQQCPWDIASWYNTATLSFVENSLLCRE